MRTGRLAGSALVSLAVLALAVRAAAQCPDGTPLPCVGARRPAPRPSAPAPAARARTFLLLPFRNVTRGEAQEWLTAGAPLMLASALGQFRERTVASDERLLAARRRLGLGADAAADAAQLWRLAEATGGLAELVADIDERNVAAAQPTARSARTAVPSLPPTAASASWCAETWPASCADSDPLPRSSPTLPACGGTSRRVAAPAHRFRSRSAKRAQRGGARSAAIHREVP